MSKTYSRHIFLLFGYGLLSGLAYDIKKYEKKGLMVFLFLNLLAEQVIQAIDPKKVEIIQRYS